MSDWESALAKHARERADVRDLPAQPFVAGYLDSAVAGAVRELERALTHLTWREEAYWNVKFALARLTPPTPKQAAAPSETPAEAEQP